MTTIARLDVPRERPTTPRLQAVPDAAPGDAGTTGVLSGTSAAAEARREPHPAVVERIQAELGIRQPAVEGYGPTPALSEDLLLQGYGLRTGEAR